MREAGESSTGKLGMCTLGRPCARPTGGTHGRTTGTPILLISIRFPLKKWDGTPRRITPTLVVLVAARFTVAGESEGPEPSTWGCGSYGPMEEAGATSTGPFS
jgi:hypothetical protein